MCAWNKLKLLHPAFFAGLRVLILGIIGLQNSPASARTGLGLGLGALFAINLQAPLLFINFKK